MFSPEDEDGSERHRNWVCVRNMNTRPCFAGHHFALVFVYWVMKCCVRFNRRFVIVDPLETTLKLVAKYFAGMFNRLDEFDKNIICDMQKAATCTPADIGIARLFTIENHMITLQPAAFPTAAQLNSEEYVQKHNEKKKRGRERKRTQDHGNV